MTVAALGDGGAVEAVGPADAGNEVHGGNPTLWSVLDEREVGHVARRRLLS